MAAQRIAGKWRGNYQYNDPAKADHGSSFNAEFLERSARFEGTILDDYAPCEAHVSGVFSFPSVQFMKVYARPELVVSQISENGEQRVYMVEDYGNPVDYQGIMSEDGKTMSGSWTIKIGQRSVNGTWSAFRIAEEEKKTVQETTTTSAVTTTQR